MNPQHLSNLLSHFHRARVDPPLALDVPLRLNDPSDTKIFSKHPLDLLVTGHAQDTAPFAAVATPQFVNLRATKRASMIWTPHQARLFVPSPSATQILAIDLELFDPALAPAGVLGDQYP